MTVQMCTARAAATPGTRDDTGAVRPRASTGARSDGVPSSKRERPTPQTARRRRGDSSDDPDASGDDASDGLSSDDDDARRDRWEAKRRRIEVERSTRRAIPPSDVRSSSSLLPGDHRRSDDDDARFDPATEGTPGPPCVLRLEYWMRSEECTERKRRHVAAIDASGGYWGMEDHIERTVFRRVDDETGVERSVAVALEPNMFPYECPPGVTHWTMWSREEMSPSEICAWTKTWLRKHKPSVTRWNFDMNDNNSVDVPHYHVFLFEPPETRARAPGATRTRTNKNGDTETRAEATERADATRIEARREKTGRPQTPPPFGDEAQEPDE